MRHFPLLPKLAGLLSLLAFDVTGCAAVPAAGASVVEAAPPAAAVAQASAAVADLAGIPELPVAGVATYRDAPVAHAPVAVFCLGRPEVVGSGLTAADGSFLVKVHGVKAGVPLELVAYQAGHVLATVAFARPDSRLLATRGLYDISQLTQMTTIATGVLSNALYALGATTAVRDPERVASGVTPARLAFDGYLARHNGASTLASGVTLLALAPRLVAMGGGNLVDAHNSTLVATGGGNLSGSGDRRLLALDACPSYVETLHAVVLSLRTKAGSGTGLSAGYRLAAASDSAASTLSAYASFTGLYARVNSASVTRMGEPVAASDLPAYSPGFVQAVFDAGAAAPDTARVGAALRYFFGESEGDAAALEHAALLVQQAAPVDLDPTHVAAATLPSYVGPSTPTAQSVAAAARPAAAAATTPTTTPTSTGPAAPSSGGSGPGGGSPMILRDVDVKADVAATNGALVTTHPEVLVHGRN